MDARDDSPQERERALHQLVDEVRERARRAIGLPGMQRPLCPVERPFTEEERGRVTILICGVTWKHEELIKAVFQGAGYRCERLPTPTYADFQTGKDYGNKGQCNPAYFTVGSLINYLRTLEKNGIPRRQIVNDYLLLMAGSCGPCRFGMYEAEFRLALRGAGFDGFRVLLFQQTAGVRAAGTGTGLTTTVDFGMGILNAVHLGDALHDIMYRIRPYELNSGETDRVLRSVGDDLARLLRERRHWDLATGAPAWLQALLEVWPQAENVFGTTGKIVHNLFATEFVDAMEAGREQIHCIQVDRLRVKPVVKTVGEFWAQTTESDGNFNMFAFLEQEGAQVLPEPVGTWASYMLYFFTEQSRFRRNAEAKYLRHERDAWKKRLADDWQARQKRMTLRAASLLWTHLYGRVLRQLGGLPHRPASQQELARLAHPYLHTLFDGGEGYMEVGENIYYSSHHLCHMVLSLKPFGCMPSSQSDGVQSHIASCYKEMIYLPIETSGEGEVNAHSRVQMALAEAKAKARNEFDRVLETTGRQLETLREYVAGHEEMQRALYRYPRRDGVAGTAAQFAWHIHDRMIADGRIWRRMRVVVPRVNAKSKTAGARSSAVSAARAEAGYTRGQSSSPTDYLVGLDVGSTTVKAVVTDSSARRILWQDYQRHQSRQPEKVLELLERMQREIGISTGNTRIFITGSGGQSLASTIGAKFVQEVHAVSLAVEEHHQDVYSVIELGGQDAKIIIFRDDAEAGRKKRIPSMNDKCAGGTGAVIDKINAKLKIPAEELADLRYTGVKLHKVAGKCGVFAETDIIGLQKQGIPERELMASLFEAIVLQNLSVLTRGNTLHPRVLLLGGPNVFMRGLKEAWQQNLVRLWQERSVPLPREVVPESLIEVPPNALYFPALGAAAFGREEPAETARYAGTEKLERYIQFGRQQEKARSGVRALVESEAELEAFRHEHRKKPWHPVACDPGRVVKGFVGLDGGSTSTKAAVLDRRGKVLCKAYRLSNGNPIQDAIELLGDLRGQVNRNGGELEVLGLATTGYAKDVLKDVLQADLAIVETVAHTASALKYYDDPHVIVDVGGQDIKIIILKDGRVKDFRLNTQCSAGNGYFLQSTAEDFGVPLEEYADIAFSARTMPVFGYGCAVFLQSDIVNFQRQGWRRNEILAGLAAVLPKNIFLYVAGMPNLAALGTRFVLQGGTQRNLAVVKAEEDFIRASFPGTGVTPEIYVHEHCGESGAIGAAQEAIEQWHEGRPSSFIGFEATAKIRYRTTRNESTRCVFCRNNCLRTFIDVSTAGAGVDGTDAVERRLIIATCEKGAAADVAQMRSIKAEIEAVRKNSPNLIEFAVRETFRQRVVELVADLEPAPRGRFASVDARRRAELRAGRREFRVGLPRVLNAYNYAPFFNGYFASLGIAPENIVYSDYTTPDLYREGASRGSIDPCYPSKIGIAHVQNLLSVKHRRAPLNAIFFPMYEALEPQLVNITGAAACPTVTATPEVVKAAFMKERNDFELNGIAYVEPMLNMRDRSLCAEQMFQAWAPLLGLSREESDRALAVGYGMLREVDKDIQRQALAALEHLEREDRIGIVILGRSYHHDPGLNHQIPEEFQKLGYPVFSQSTLPLDDALLDRLFGAEVRAGFIDHPLDIADVWKNRFSAGTNLKLWAAKFTARHPNLVAVEFSNFKCGHDAPAYKLVETIVEQSGTPYFCFKDLDENKPASSIRLRIETIDYFLRRYRDEVVWRRKKTEAMEVQLAEYESNLVARHKAG